MADNGFTRMMQKFAEQLVFEVPLEFASENGGVSRKNLELAWTFGEIALVRRDIFNFTHRAKDPTKLALVMIVWELKTIHMKLRARVREISREIHKMGAKAIPEPCWYYP